MSSTTKFKQPKQRVRAEERRLRGLEYLQKNKALFDRERQMRMLRDARCQAEQLENFLAQREAVDEYLSKLNPAYHQAADEERRAMQRKVLGSMVQGAFRGRAPWGRDAHEGVQRLYPASYGRLREVVGG